MAQGQRPLELIHARNLITGLSTPAFLVDEEGELVFYNDAAGALLGRRFEEVGRMGPEEWGNAFGPFDREGRPLDLETAPAHDRAAPRPPLPRTLRHPLARRQRAPHPGERDPDHHQRRHRGAMAIFWPDHDGEG